LHPDHRHFGSVTPGPDATIGPSARASFDAARHCLLTQTGFDL
jgi:hypothetical protein